MKLLKSAVVAISLALSLGSFSTTAVACEDGRVCVGNEQAVANIVGHIDEALKSIDANDSAAAIAHMKEAKRAKKEMNSEANAPKIGRLSAHFHKAKKLLKGSDTAGAKAELEKAKHGYKALRF
ncbi:MAG: hypothetical protein GQ532_18625 [Methylomarinum sp.]|nr:hypothetical protein [Methylomarinum sp.]